MATFRYVQACLELQKHQLNNRLKYITEYPFAIKGKEEEKELQETINEFDLALEILNPK